MNRLQINNVSFAYGRNKIFDDFSLNLEDGINVVLGPNGSGKTTLFKMLTTIISPKKGEILLNNIDCTTSDYRKHIAYVPQNFNIFPNIKVCDFLLHIARIKLDRKEQIDSELKKAAEQTAITDFLNKKMKELSGGMRQRVGIAQALIGSPELIVADEPTAGLDPEQRARFNHVIRNIPKNHIILISTHIIEDIENFSDQIIVLSKGKNKFVGDFNSFSTSMSEKVVEVRLPIEEFMTNEKEFDHYKIIGKEFEQSDIILRIMLPSDFDLRPAMKQVAPTLSEIWSYHEQ